MNTPILDFIRNYAQQDIVRLHMPGHKGMPLLGCEALDITEITGADALYEASGIIAQSEAIATAMFGTRKTLYATEGSSQCIRAMLYLALTCRNPDASTMVLAARNVHKSFVYGAALLDLTPIWLWPEDSTNLHCCPVAPRDLEQALSQLSQPPAAVYITSPDYLGHQQEISDLADICHRHKTLLLVDNAHGAYLHFLSSPVHPMDLGADLCCDSAHKTLPVLTGGAYLHIAPTAPPTMAAQAKQAMALFGSTSPSYLTLASLDSCNAYLARDYATRLELSVRQLDTLKGQLAQAGWHVSHSDPLRLTLRTGLSGIDGNVLLQKLHRLGIECEYASRDFLVCMFTPENSAQDYIRLFNALQNAPQKQIPFSSQLLPLRPKAVCTPRQALFSSQITVPTAEALGRICGTPTVACPPAIPIVISGERINEAAVSALQYYNIAQISVLP